MAEEFKSTDDRRTSNNIMRHNYRALSEGEKLRMAQVKDLGVSFVELLHVIGGTIDAYNISSNKAQVRLVSRELSLAQTKMEEAVMWAVKHITG